MSVYAVLVCSRNERRSLFGLPGSLVELFQVWAGRLTLYMDLRPHFKRLLPFSLVLMNDTEFIVFSSSALPFLSILLAQI